MSDKRAKIEAMKAVMAKKRAADEQRGLTFKGAGSSRGSSTTSAITSRVVADVVVLGPPRVTVKNNTYLDVAVLSVNAGEGKGRALVPTAGTDSDFKIAPLTDEKGEYLIKSELTLKGGWKKTEERKPLALAEYSVVTLKLGNAPSGPADWASSFRMAARMSPLVNLILSRAWAAFILFAISRSFSSCSCLSACSLRGLWSYSCRSLSHNSLGCS